MKIPSAYSLADLTQLYWIYELEDKLRNYPNVMESKKKVEIKRNQRIEYSRVMQQF